MKNEETTGSANKPRQLHDMEVVYLEMLAEGRFDRPEELEEADWVALVEEEHIGDDFSRHPYFY